MTQAADNTLPEPFVALLSEQLGSEAESHELTPHATFESLGMDSLALMEMVVAAEERFGIVPSEEAMDLSPSATLSDAARAFADAR
ncbi:MULTISPECIES: acyl carrier protein [unclassified Streptomyces]|uniref:acyl carrier protein n=1 Tax=unclassified Streptomyces TaxID=2593676 RepID=UPI00278BCAE6|nr:MULTISPECIES: acyl carrier protein [unclassified Streptomyces]